MTAPIPPKTRPVDRLADFTRDPRIAVLSGMAVIVGAVSAVVALALVRLIALFTHLAFEGRFSTADVAVDPTRLGPWLVLVPVVGGLLIGLMARYGSEKIRGHGIPEALEAILIGRSRLSAKVAILKPVSSAISIGTGGPFGAEGPIIMTGGAFGSLFAQLFHLTSSERKTLLVAGAAAGMAAIFGAPLAAVLLAVELLLFEWRPRSLIPVALACATAWALRVPLFGSEPVFGGAPHDTVRPVLVAAALIPGVIAGLGSALLTTLVYLFEDLFHRLPLHWMWWPAIGGAFIGVCGLVDPRVLGVGYDTIRSLLAGHGAGGAIVLLFVVKALAWSFALGSGTSGGVLAPLLMLGGALGLLEAQTFLPGDAGMWALVGMAAMMAGTMRSPLTSIVFAIELTHDIAALPLLLVACASAHGVTVLLMSRSILTEKVARRGLHVTREYAVDPFALVRVGDVMDSNLPLVPVATTVSALADQVGRGESPLGSRQAALLIGKDGVLAGIVTRGDLFRAVECGAGDFSVVDAGSHRLVVAYPDETVRDAVERMLAADVGRLPVVTREDPHRAVGYLGRSGVLAARVRLHEDENRRERGAAASA